MAGGQDRSGASALSPRGHGRRNVVTWRSGKTLARDPPRRGVESSERRRKRRRSRRVGTAEGWDYEVRVHQILSRLNIHNLDQPIRQLSGGQKKRIALAKALIDPADLILMDEPTNHLDVEMVEWLEDHLQRSQLALLIVTHDRYFLENITNKIIELDGGELYSYDGNYSYFLEKKAERNTTNRAKKTKLEI